MTLKPGGLTQFFIWKYLRQFVYEPPAGSPIFFTRA
jgi:hypothetical protein